jgi:hypothetical protein
MESIGAALSLDRIFVVCPRAAPLLVEWKQQFDRLLLASVDCFVQGNRDHSTYFQGIDIPDYLAIHVAARRSIKTTPT